MIQTKLYLTLILCVPLFCRCNNGDTDFIFPENSKGWFVYVSDTVNGKEVPEIVNGRYKVVFPKDGIYFSKFAVPKGRGNRFYFENHGFEIHLSLNSESLNDSLKICNIIPQTLGFSVNYFKEEIGNLPSAIDTFLDYDLLIFNVNKNCEESESLDSFMKRVKIKLIEHNKL